MQKIALEGFYCLAKTGLGYCVASDISMLSAIFLSSKKAVLLDMPAQLARQEFDTELRAVTCSKLICRVDKAHFRSNIFELV